jgi:hypothetical protein
MTHERDTNIEGVSGNASELLAAADSIEAMGEAMAAHILSLGEEHAAALRVKAYLMKG